MGYQSPIPRKLGGIRAVLQGDRVSPGDVLEEIRQVLELRGCPGAGIVGKADDLYLDPVSIRG